MPRAEVGTSKHLSNKMKAKGLGRLRWYCQACERQMRDENGFKCHVQSESHVRQMQLIGEDPKRHIENYSQQFLRDFLQLLKTAHGTKPVHINHFYQEYIANKEHIHMNATRWPSLTEFAKYLGREGICRVSDDDKGLYVSWVDNSPEALRRQEAIRKKERMERGDEEREQRMIQEQVERARARAKEAEDKPQIRELQRADGEKITLNFGTKPAKKESEPPRKGISTGNDEVGIAASNQAAEDASQPLKNGGEELAVPASSMEISFSSAPAKRKNVFATKKNPLATKKASIEETPRKMSEAERIMKEELEQKRLGEQSRPGGLKRQRVT
ncbi:domain of Kin17 curved DNA-binding protein-domain-containing protein [Lineolata rhizophorae]|uniref:Domain of Kin17 curved DNA-binding protein-domain-containing protein n=1 Tax=Lineolata rhizophorae TaxID=578093 RepID=A0A6A6NZ54_9PEZI|nr:domain of Kin17 curved DNA-binding protein-domain-containing protein [Lineolata rhizophorae]